LTASLLTFLRSPYIGGVSMYVAQLFAADPSHFER